MPESPKLSDEVNLTAKDLHRHHRHHLAIAAAVVAAAAAAAAVPQHGDRVGTTLVRFKPPNSRVASITTTTTTAAARMADRRIAKVASLLDRPWRHRATLH